MLSRYTKTAEEAPCKVEQHMTGDSSNWFTLGNLSETNMELMSAGGLYKKSKMQAISVAACLPPPVDRRRESWRRGRQGRNKVAQRRCADHRPGQ